MKVDENHVGKRVGFTGTREGLTAPQEVALRELLGLLQPNQFHHGDARGADALAATICNNMKLRPTIICHPPLRSAMRAFTLFNDKSYPKDDYHPRNRNIVHCSDLLVACPQLVRKRQDKGGTWYTIKFAEKQGRSVYAVWPDGTVSTPEEGLPQ